MGRFAQWMLVAVLLSAACGSKQGSGGQKPHGSSADEPDDMYVIFDHKAPRARWWRGELRWSIAGAKVTDLVAPDRKGGAAYATQDRARSVFLRDSRGRVIGALSVRADLTVSLALDVGADGTVDFLSTTDIMGSHVRLFLNDKGAALIEAWQARRNPLCDDAGGAGQEGGDTTSTLTQPGPQATQGVPGFDEGTSYPACGRGNQGSGAIGSLFPMGTGPRGPMDPFDMLCSGTSTRPDIGGTQADPANEPLPPADPDATPEEEKEFWEVVGELIRRAFKDGLSGDDPPEPTERDVVEAWQRYRENRDFLQRKFPELWPRPPAPTHRPPGPEGQTPPMLEQLCKARQSNRGSIGDQAEKAVTDRECLDPAETSDPPQEPPEKCFGSTVERADMAEMARAADCPPDQTHCALDDSDPSDRFRNLRVHGVVEAREICDPTVCQPGN